MKEREQIISWSYFKKKRTLLAVAMLEVLLKVELSESGSSIVFDMEMTFSR